MSFKCRTGLFVGVNRYEHLQEAKWLRSAASDALQMLRHFELSDEGGRWELLVDGSESRPARRELVDRIYSFVTNVKSGESGIFYFSGHGHVVSDGLVLAPSDFHEEYADDSGVPLKRVFWLMRAYSAPNAKFFLLLDCCRDGTGARLGDDIPPNTSVLYACEPGKVTLEDQESGLLGRHFRTQLRKHAGKRARRYASLRSVFNRLPPELNGFGPDTSARPELCGNWAQEILLPLAESLPIDDAFRKPAVELKSRDLGVTYKEELNEVRSFLKSYVGGAAAKSMLRNASPPHIKVKLPKDMTAVHPRTLFEHCIEECSVFVQANLKWPETIEWEQFNLLAKRHSGGFNLIPQMEDNVAIMSWESKPYQGQVYLERAPENELAATITCRSGSGKALLPLHFLLPHIGNIYASLVAGELT